MAYFKKCSYCGANLDPCEKCDCKRTYEKKKQEEKILKMVIEIDGQHKFLQGMKIKKEDYINAN